MRVPRSSMFVFAAAKAALKATVRRAVRSIFEDSGFVLFAVRCLR
jgi:hypothetical protein